LITAREKAAPEFISVARNTNDPGLPGKHSSHGGFLMLDSAEIIQFNVAACLLQTAGRKKIRAVFV
jgi:hypothetical protein